MFLERIEAPSQISLHRRVHVGSSSNESLRDDARKNRYKENEKEDVITKTSPSKKFYRHKSLNILKTAQPGKGFEHYDNQLVLIYDKP